MYVLTICTKNYLRTTSERLDSKFFFHFEIVVHFLRLLINKLCVSLKLLLLVQTECNEKKSKHDAFWIITLEAG